MQVNEEHDFAIRRGGVYKRDLLPSDRLKATASPVLAARTCTHLKNPNRSGSHNYADKTLRKQTKKETLNAA